MNERPYDCVNSKKRSVSPSFSDRPVRPKLHIKKNLLYDRRNAFIFIQFWHQQGKNARPLFYLFQDWFWSKNSIKYYTVSERMVHVSFPVARRK